MTRQVTAASFRCLVCVALAFRVGVLPATAQQRPVTVSDLMTLSTIVDVRISPDGNQVAYVVSKPSLEKNQHEASLYVVSTSGGDPRRLAEGVRLFGGNLPAPRLRWSPSGNISFLGFSNDKPQVYVVDRETLEAKVITIAAEGAWGYEWSPDGRSMAYLTRDPVPAEEQAQRKENSYVTHVDAPERAVRLAVSSVGGTEQVLSPADKYVESLSWSHDGRDIAYAAASTTGFLSQYDTRIYVVNARGGPARAVVDRKGMNSSPRYSPDGSGIAFVSSAGKVSIMAPRGLAIVSVGGGSAVRDFDLNGAWVSDITWTPDSQGIYLLTTDGTFGQKSQMFAQPAVKVNVVSGEARLVTGRDMALYSLSLDRDGRFLTFRGVESRTMGDVVVHDLQRDERRKLTDVNPHLRDFALGDLKPLSWKSFDGKEVWGLLLTPPGYKEGGKVPLLVYCHGGPNGGVTHGLFPQFMHVVSQIDYYPVEAMASAGYAVFFPMPRGGMGYGESGQRAIINDWGGADYKDIMTGVDDLIKKGLADPDKLGVMGASYGGYMTNWIVTQTGRFKAASAGASLSDLEDQYFLSDGGEVMAEYFKRPWEARESYRTHSPLTYADRVTTPLLLQHGERDLRVPIANAWKFYRALKQMGKTVEFDIHPRSSHVFYEPQQERAAMQRNLEWFTRWIPLK